MGLEVVPGKGAPFDPNVRPSHASSFADAYPYLRRSPDNPQAGPCAPAAGFICWNGGAAGLRSRCVLQVHDAIMRAPSDEVPDGTVLQEFRKGFRMGSTLLRPAMVQVSGRAIACR